MINKAYNLQPQKEIGDRKLDGISASEQKGLENEALNPESVELEPNQVQKPIDLRTIEWIDLETSRLLKWIHQYGKLNGHTLAKPENPQAKLPTSCQSNGWASGSNVRNYYMQFKNRIAKSKKKLTGLIEDIGGNIVSVPLEQPDKSNWYYDDDGDDPEMRHYIWLAERGIKIFKITKNASKDDITSKYGDGEYSHKRYKFGDERDSDMYSDASNYQAIPSKLMYGTINTLYKEYINSLDSSKYPELHDLTRKYMSRPLFIIDKSEHKKKIKEKKREAKKIK